MSSASTQKNTPKPLPKAPTGITGLDEITGGGLPKGRPTLICGEAGCGKTLFSIEFIVRGAMEFNEPGILLPLKKKPKNLLQMLPLLALTCKSLLHKKS